MNAEDIALPSLADARIDEIEDAVFARIARERTAAAHAERTRRTRRRRWWAVGGAAAAVVVVAAVIAPGVTGLIAGPAGGAHSTAEQAYVEPAPDARDAAGGPVALDPATGAAEDLKLVEPGAGGPVAGREVITTASATVEVDDVQAAARAIAALADEEGGYVESMSVGDDRAGVSGYAPESLVYPGPTGAWVTVRVPADRLSAVTESLSEIGEVSGSRIDRADVTTAAVDLRARVAALEASVARLTELMAQATSTGDLIAAESALAQRQGELDSYRQQLEGLEGQVELSSLTVSLVTPVEHVEADPAGFVDGVLAGWNGLVATLNGIVVALGFLLPWLVVLGVLGIALWAVRRVVRRRRARRRAGDDAPADAPRPGEERVRP